MSLAAILGIGGKLIDKLFPDPAERTRAQIALLELTQRGELTELTERAGIIRAEAASDHWLAANWRPLLMLTFGGLIVARWFGWAAPNLTEAEYLKLWDIVHFGIGGYVVGRSAEKIVPMVAESLRGPR